MPELPEVETVRRTLLPHVVGQRIAQVTVSQPSLRWPVDVGNLCRRIRGRRVLDIRRRAKYLLFDVEGDSVMAVHLGMSGQLGLSLAPTPARLHDHVVLTLEDGRQLRLNDPRRFGSVDAFARTSEAAHPRLAHLGAEPLDAEQFDGARLFAASRRLHKPVKNFLMDATRIVGVGNIYACEALFAAGIHPNLPAGRLSRPQAMRLAACIVTVLQAAIAQGGTTLRDFADGLGHAGCFKVQLHVYGREKEPCVQCARPVRRQVQAGRSTFYCPTCQRR
jgi:formamidopyrimidine-DNA glycosylase